MKEALALIAYGLLLLSGVFMTVFWGRIAYRRYREMRSKWSDDKYFILAACLCLSSIGTGLFFSARAWMYMTIGFSTVSRPSMTSYLILAGLFTLAVAKAGFVWAVHCTKDSWVWKAFIGLSVLWLIIALGWIELDPFNTYPYGG